jgi:hypothetical protein
MSLTEAVKAALKRGALVTAANWEVIVIQFVAESAFKALLMVPVVGAAFLVTLLVGASVEDVVSGDLRQTVSLAVDALGQHTGALIAYLAGVGVVVVGGSILMFVVKAGSVSVLVGAERTAPAVEHPPLRFDTVRRAESFSLEAFAEGSARFRGRFVALGLWLLVVYGATAAAYLAAVVSTYRWTSGFPVSGTLAAAVVSLVLVGWITLVNLFYLLVQLLLTARDTSVVGAVRALPSFLAAERRVIGGLFLAVVLLVLLATAATILATAAVGFIGFVPVFGLAMLPLQFLAWIGRGLLFEFLGLSAMTAYACVLRTPTRSPQPHAAMGARWET